MKKDASIKDLEDALPYQKVAEFEQKSSAYQMIEDMICGLHKEDALRIFKTRGYTLRFTKVNGKSNVLTQDIRENRFNVELEDDIVQPGGKWY